jgi:hypothetical protein
LLDGGRTLLIAAMGERLTASERGTFTAFTGRQHEPLKRVSQFAVIAGRRGGKTQAVAALGTYLSAVCDYRGVLAPGETGVLLALAQDQRIAKKILDFVESNLRRSKILRQRFVGRTQDAIELNNGVRIEVRPASFRKLRGPTYIGVIADELAFWHIETHEGHYVDPDVEVLAAARPGLLTTHGPLILASSPYSKRGALWDLFSRHYGPDGAPNILIARGGTRDFNPTISKAEIDALLAEDPVRNASEYLAQFRGDVESFISLDAVEACVGSYFELAPSPNVSYFCYADPAGGSGEDSFAITIAHRDGTQVIISAVREWTPPFRPDEVIANIAGLCKSYNIRTVYGDRFGDSFSAELFRQNNLIYEVVKQTKSNLYAALLPMLNAKRIVLPRHDRLVRQIVGLERQTTRAGHDSISHAPGALDDIANALAGAAHLAHTALPALWASESFLDADGQAAAPPKRVLCLFMTIVAAVDASQLGIAFFQGAWNPNGGLLYLVDALIGPPGAATLQTVLGRFNELFEQAPTCHVHGQEIVGRLPEVYCQEIIGDQLDVLLGRATNTRPIDDLLASGDLALAATMHTSKVRVTAAVLEKYGLGFLDGTAGRGSDILRTAVLVGIVACFDANRLTTTNGPKRLSVNAN